MLNCAEIKITFLVITHTIAPVNFHSSPKVLCTCAPNENNVCQASI